MLLLHWKDVLKYTQIESECYHRIEEYARIRKIVFLGKETETYSSNTYHGLRKKGIFKTEFKFICFKPLIIPLRNTDECKTEIS